MTQFRVSDALLRAGVTEAEQHIIFGKCTKHKTQQETDSIRLLCASVAGENADALFRFLTDRYINHVYICMHYNVPRDKLFAWKRKFYVAAKNELI